MKQLVINLVNTVTFVYLGLHNLLSSFQEFFEYIERERAKDFETLARKYRAIGPLLTKMEGLVVHTNTGRSPKLAQYYAYWERKIFNALNKVRGLFLASTILIPRVMK